MEDLKQRVAKIVLDETRTKDERQQALLPLMKEHMEKYDNVQVAMDTWAHMVADIVEEHNLRRH